MTPQSYIRENLFEGSGQAAFNERALDMFRFQYENCAVYKQYCQLTQAGPENVSTITEIPFLPIGFFKNKEVKTTSFEAELIFESSKTTGAVASRHFVKEKSIYAESFLRTFKLFYGDIEKYCVIGLLPSYLERGNASLVFMVNELIQRSKHTNSGFYLNDFKELAATLKKNEESKQPTLLIGVTFALLDFASEYPLPLSHTIVMETGGMKGRKKEMTREEVHSTLQARFSTGNIHAEYGMTELLSQAYAKSKGRFSCPPWMRMLVRAADDPFDVKQNRAGNRKVNGLGNIIDLANMYSCAFIATEDVISLHADNTFEVLGRADNSDIRGCSLMAHAI